MSLSIATFVTRLLQRQRTSRSGHEPEKAGWDREILAIELQHLTDLDLDFDITATGFEMAEIDLLLSGTEETDPADIVPEVAPGPAVTRIGDIWQIGRHRLICGDSTMSETYARLLDGERAQMVFSHCSRASGTTPPYNVKIDGHVCGLSAAKHREFAMASGEMSETEFTGFLARVFASLVEHAIDGAIHFVCMDWRHVGEVLAASTPTYTELKNICVGAKTNGGVIAERCYASTGPRWSPPCAPAAVATASSSTRSTAMSSCAAWRRSPASRPCTPRAAVRSLNSPPSA